MEGKGTKFGSFSGGVALGVGVRVRVGTLPNRILGKGCPKEGHVGAKGSQQCLKNEIRMELVKVSKGCSFCT